MTHLIQIARHSGGVNSTSASADSGLPTFGAGRNPDDLTNPRVAGQHLGFVRFAEVFSWLDTGLMELLASRLSWQTTPAKSLVMRRYDEVLCE